jgi:hypothetical protein
VTHTKEKKKKKGEKAQKAQSASCKWWENPGPA